MDAKLVAGAALVGSPQLITAAANTVGIAKTGTAIATLHGAAHTSATAAWVGLGSMKVGMLVMGALPVVGTLLLLDGICREDYGVCLVDRYEEAWRQREIDWELEDMKRAVKVDKDHQLRAKTTAASFAQLDNQFHALGVEHELYLLKKQMGLL